MKLQYKILLPLIALIVLLMAGSTIITYRSSSESMEEALIDSMATANKNMKHMLRRVLTDALQDLRRTASRQGITSFVSSDMQDPSNVGNVVGVLQHLVDTYPKFSSMTILDKNGIIVASSLQNEALGRNFSDRDYFQASVQGKQFLTSPIKSAITQQGIIIASAPVYADGAKETGDIMGVVYGTIDLETLYTDIVEPVKIGDQGYAYVVDKLGRYVIDAPARAGRLFNAEHGDIALFLRLLKEPDGLVTIQNAAGDTVTLYHGYDADTGLMSVVRAEFDDVFSGLASLRTLGVSVTVISAILAALVIFGIVRPVIAALNKSMIFAQKIAEGHLDAKLEIKRNDEIGHLAKALRAIPQTFNAVMDEYATLEKKIGIGDLAAVGDPSKFSGDFAKLIQGTNTILDRFRVIIENIPPLVITLDNKHQARYANASARALVGENYKGKTCLELVGREDYDTPQCALRRSIERKTIETSETVAHPAGRVMDVKYTAIPLFDENNELVSVFQLVTDLTEIKSTQRNILEVASQALEISDRTATAADELSAQVDQTMKGTEIQRDRVSSTATAMEEMNSTVLEVARNAGQTRTQAEATQKRATEGSDLVQQVIQAIEQVNQVTLELERDMQHLGKQAENIGSVMNVISDIADQTNLLALNAAIEAARAGDAGRGFAVVADEVRKLAEKTTEATSEVGESIRGIQTSATSNIGRVAKAGEVVKHSTDLAVNSGEALNEILSLANNTFELITGIAAAAEEQSATSEEINHAVEEINNIAGETAEGMNNSAQAVAELANLSHDLNLVLDRLRAHP